jgi:hypothetical protein
MICDIHNNILRRFIAGALALALAFPSGYVHAQGVVLPPAGDKVGLSQSFQPAILSAVTVDPQNPLQFEFYVDPGQALQKDDSQEEYLLLVKDFMVSLTVPEEQLWVNLSPYEKDRIIDDRFGLTEMGRDLLAQDYILKQITASLIYPEEGIGKEFWAEVYSRAQDEFGTTDIPVDAFNKVWIMPDVAEVYQKGASAMVLKAHLKVMLEADYLATEHNVVGTDLVSAREPAQELTKQILREIIVPLLEKEVNEGANFARLRQIYNALILAAWYKRTMRETFLGKAYVDQGKVKGIEQQDPAQNKRIYDQYVDAFRKGVFNYVKEEIDRYSGELIPRKYLSGGFLTGADFSEKTLVVRTTIDAAENHGKKKTAAVKVSLRSTNKGMHNFEPVIGEDKKGSLNISRIKEIAKKIYELESAGRTNFTRPMDNPDFSRFQKEQRSLVKAAFRRMIDAQENDDLLIEIFNSFIEPNAKTGLNSLALSGEYTMDVFEQFMALSLFSRDRDLDKVSLEKIFQLAGLEPALFERFRSLMRSLKTRKDYSDLYQELMAQTVKKYKEDGVQADLVRMFENNIFIRPELNDLSDLTDLRNKDPEFHFEGNLGRLAWVQRMIRSAERLLPKAYNRLITLAGMLKVNEMRNLLYVRVKSEESLDSKLVLSSQGPDRITDEIAGRIAVRSLQEMEKMDKQIMGSSLRFSSYQESMRKKEEALLESKGPAKAGKLQEIREQIKNFIHPEKSVMVKRSSYLFQDMERVPWYKGVHYVVMLGDSLWTIELQLKTLRQAILHDIEHKLYYSVLKRDKKSEVNAQLYENLINYVWLLNSIELMGYVHAKDPQLAERVLDDAIAERDKSQITPDQKRDRVSRNEGGIDVRNVDGALAVQGQRTGFSGGMFEMRGEEIEGLLPVILSVTPLEGLPFLQETSPPGGIFSNN